MQDTGITLYGESRSRVTATCGGSERQGLSPLPALPFFLSVHFYFSPLLAFSLSRAAVEQVGWLLPRAPLSPPPLLALFSFNLGCYPPKGRSGEKTVLKNGNVVLLFLTSCCKNMFRGRNLYLPGNNTAFSYDPPPFSTSRLSVSCLFALYPAVVGRVRTGTGVAAAADVDAAAAAAVRRTDEKKQGEHIDSVSVRPPFAPRLHVK